MGGLGSAFGIISGALDNDQQAIDVTANNVANVSTPGYTVEEASWTQSDPVDIRGGQWGTGATAASISSRRDTVLEARLHQQQQAQSAAQTRADGLSNLENIFPIDSGTDSASNGGIADSLTDFFTSASALADDPSSTASRQGVLASATALATSFNTAAAQIASQQSQLAGQVSSDTGSANSLLSAIATLNQKITSSAPTADAGTLEDQRQQDLLSLSQLIGFTQVATENNGISLTTTGGAVLVSGGTAVSLGSAVGNAGVQVFAGSANVTAQISGGSVGGELTLANADLPAVSQQLDTLANGFATQVNQVLAHGTDAYGNAGSPLFSVSATVSGSAAALTVALTDPSKLAASSGTGTGDNANANALAALANSATIGGQTASSYLATTVSTLGNTSQSATTQASALSASLTQLTSQRNSISGVSQDEEAAALQQFESAYQAASKVFSVLSSLMDSALNLGIAGVAAQ